MSCLESYGYPRACKESTDLYNRLVGDARIIWSRAQDTERVQKEQEAVMKSKVQSPKSKVESRKSKELVVEPFEPWLLQLIFTPKTLEELNLG